MNKVAAILQGMSSQAIMVLTVVLTLVVGMIDLSLMPAVSTSLFYFLPIIIAAWYGSRNHAMIISCMAAAVWLVTDITSGQLYDLRSIFIWNTFVRLAIFLIISILASSFRKTLGEMELQADTDSLTGAVNLRGLRDRLSYEYMRSDRYGSTFSLAYIDVDNFKQVNDTLGHSSGDELLIRIVEILKNSLRKTDVVARLSGDEFVILFPETAAAHIQDAFQHAFEKLTEEVENRPWPISFSVGVVSYERLPTDIDQVLKIADETMYRVKKSTKNSIIYRIWD